MITTHTTDAKKICNLHKNVITITPPQIPAEICGHKNVERVSDETNIEENGRKV
jgi:hypothetical protein